MNESDDRVAAWLSAATAARRRGAIDEERRLIELARQAAPANAQVCNTLGVRALADKDYDTAVTAFLQASRSEPGEPSLLLNLAHAYRLKRDVEGERFALQAALNLDQRSFTAQYRMAELLEREGLISQAARHWSAVVQLTESARERSPLMVDARAHGKAFLAEHDRAFAAALEQELGNMLSTGRDGHRFRACLDHVAGRRKIYSNNCAGIHYPFLPADEFFDRSHFPWFEELERRTTAIAAEAAALTRDNPGSIRPYVQQDPGTPLNQWSELNNRLEWSACFLWEYGKQNESVCAICPETVAALRAVPQNHLPGQAPTAFFSILRPGAHIPPHTGVTNTRAIVHLPLIVPNRCTFRVGGEKRQWRVGEAFAFDDTIEHEAWNDSDELRTVLIFDVWNPHLTEQEQAGLASLFTVADRGIIAKGD